jgi:amino acid transporter
VKEAFRAVFWSFFGVRKRSEYEADARRLTPRAVIAAGLICTALFVLALFGIVQLVTR